ncbi:hypothetical protein COCON_G00063110 [Conger conger]|uniref:Uncharacterized protein n=1 Tax=Conger conger TaxID=82655 RepID=A0A9Q1I3P2_CONCO|nr:hypothetical protein COCON_G00063110 [Conger conger]
MISQRCSYCCRFCDTPSRSRRPQRGWATLLSPPAGPRDCVSAVPPDGREQRCRVVTHTTPSNIQQHITAPSFPGCENTRQLPKMTFIFLYFSIF